VVEKVLKTQKELFMKKYLTINFQDGYFTGGQSSDFGANYEIKSTNEQELYQTERWGSEDFFYEIPISQSGKYVLILKFSEVYFNSPSEKIFDVSLGKEIVVRQLDIYSKVGKAFAYDEYIEFDFKNNKIFVNVIIFSFRVKL
jgi:hypothetical protein